jgi:microcystin-dependent protein
MSQSDLELSNQGFPSFRAELNSALEALQTNSSGNTEPPTPEPFQWWYDTNNRQLKLRNGANDGWITVLTLNTGEEAVSSVEGATLTQLGITSTATEINKLDGFTGTVDDLNKVSGLSASKDDLDATEGLSSPTGAALIPPGGIIMWSGSIANIPAGWALCNGANGTPDLRDRFVVGAGSSYAVGATGGANTVTLTGGQMPPHTHGFSGTTNSAGNHQHLLPHIQFNAPWGVGASISSNRFLETGSGSEVDGLTGPAGAHAHSFSGTTGNAGSGQAHENRPPYYALAYIMKL